LTLFLIEKNLIKENILKELKMISYNRNKNAHHGPNDIHDYDITDVIDKLSVLIAYFEKKISDSN